MEQDRVQKWPYMISHRMTSPGCYEVTFDMPTASSFGFYITDHTPNQDVYFMILSNHGTHNKYYHHEAWINDKDMVYMAPIEMHSNSRDIHHSVTMIRYVKSGSPLIGVDPDSFMFDMNIVKYGSSLVTKHDIPPYYLIPITQGLTNIGLGVHIDIILRCTQATFTIKLRNHNMRERWKKEKIIKIEKKIANKEALLKQYQMQESNLENILDTQDILDTLHKKLEILNMHTDN